MSNIFTGAVQLAYKTSSAWASQNPVLLAGQAGYESDTLQHKIGDGVSTWNALLYAGGGGAGGGFIVQDEGSPLTTIATTLNFVGSGVVATGAGASKTITISAGGDALTSNPLSQFASTSSLQLKTKISDPTGTGSLVFANSPALITPSLGASTATSVNKVAITQPATSATLTIPDGVTLTGPTASGTAMTLGNVETITGVKTFGAAGNVGKLAVAGTTSGSTIVNASATASGTLTLPAATDTLVGKATTDVFTNKTFDTAGGGNSFSINGLAATNNTGTGSVVRDTSATLTTPVIVNAEGTVVAGSTTNLATSASQNQTVSGNTTITAFGSLAAGVLRNLVFTGSPLLTYNASSLITPTGLDIQAKPGDFAMLVSLGSGNWRVYSFTPFNNPGRIDQTADIVAGRAFTSADFMSLRSGVLQINSSSILGFTLPTVASMALTGSGNILAFTVKGTGVPTIAGATGSTTINGVAGTTTVNPAGGAAVQFGSYVIQQRGSTDVWDYS